ncbi:MAG: 2OG-Fe(II) oxygenase [Myxococcales bacterium]|nr:MAG: 2OG-Fe(II) oxygenase [Myxococcales bacterium]
MFKEHNEPRAHLVLDDFFDVGALDLVFREIRALDRRMKPGLVRDIGHDGQSVFFAHPRRKNQAVWIHDPSRTLRLFRERLWSAPLVESFERAREPLFQIIPNCWAPHLQVSRYMTGDHYDFHEDEGAGVNLTAIVFIAAEPARVRGGDLVLSYEGRQTKVRFRHNRLVIFPSKTLHRVTRTRVDSDDPQHARVSLQCWLTYGRPPAKPQRRPPEADQPTFLLAEESILAAAQALGGTGNQTPEDLYWGSFYLSRILCSNLRLIAEQAGLELGRVHVRRVDGDVEVHGRTRLAEAPVRVGFLLRGAETPPAAALSLFVERGRGAAKSVARRDVPPGADEEETASCLHRLLVEAHRLGRS